MGDGDTFSRSDMQRILREQGIDAPLATVTFTHLSTVVESTIPADVALGITTAATSADVIAALLTLQNSVNINRHLVNNAAYIFEANGLSS